MEKLQCYWCIMEFRKSVCSLISADELHKRASLSNHFSCHSFTPYYELYCPQRSSRATISQMQLLSKSMLHQQKLRNQQHNKPSGTIRITGNAEQRSFALSITNKAIFLRSDSTNGSTSAAPEIKKLKQATVSLNSAVAERTPNI